MTTTIFRSLNSAIIESLLHNRSVTVEIDDLSVSLAEITNQLDVDNGEDFDWQDDGQDGWDVYGWDDDCEGNETLWRLTLVPKAR